MKKTLKLAALATVLSLTSWAGSSESSTASLCIPMPGCANYQGKSCAAGSADVACTWQQCNEDAWNVCSCYGSPSTWHCVPF